MKLFLATDALADVHWATDRGWCDGVVLPDAALKNAESLDSAIAWLSDFARAVQVPVFVDAYSNGSTIDEFTDWARALGRAADNVVIQLPFNDNNAELIHNLSTDGISVAATFTGTATQALFAAKSGAAFIVVDVDRLDAMNGSGAEVINTARALLDMADLESELVALFPSGASSLSACGIAGADAAVVGAATLKTLLAYPFTDQALSDTARQITGGRRLRAGDI